MTTKIKITLVVFALAGLHSVAKAQVFMPYFDLEEEAKWRQGKNIREEKYYKAGVLDSVYRQWLGKEIITEGYYIKGKKHGQWRERLTNSPVYECMLLTYQHGKLLKIYQYYTQKTDKNSPKSHEQFFTMEPDPQNYTVHRILWNSKIPNKRKSEKKYIIRKRIIVKSSIKRWWSNGNSWEIEQTILQYDKNGESLGHKKHGHWPLWHKDGTLQRETWYDMGKKLREKKYDHGKLISDKSYE